MRKPRVLQDGGRYHVVARANHREMLLGSTATKDLFLATVERAKKKFDFRLENFSILGNHFHMLVHTPSGSNLSKIMKWILGVFAMSWNRIHENWGHFWGERFFSRLLTSFKDYVAAFQYITENPTKAGLAISAAHWPYGGLWHWTHGVHLVLDPLPSWIDPSIWGPGT
jgi:putative transposase